ncbi:MAG: aminotransferase class V-fold PLP-dependent enzyme [Promethearchaeota archaeon]
MSHLLDIENSEAFKELERVLYSILESYSNVHRGTGHKSLITTALYERAREYILEYLQVDKNKYVVVFCSILRLNIFKDQLKETDYFSLSSSDFGLPLGVGVIAVKKKSLKKCASIYTGGGMIKHVTSNYVVWADIPERFEAGTPNIVNIIGFAKAIQLVKRLGADFNEKKPKETKSSRDLLYQDEIFELSGKKLFLELKKLLIGRQYLVPTESGLSNFINLDSAASTPTFLPIWNTYYETIKQPDDLHKSIIQEVKDICSKFLNAPLEEYEIIFTYNTTEAVNIIAQSYTGLFKGKSKTVIINTVMEHHSNELPFRYLPGAKLIRISVDDEGFIDLGELERKLIEYNESHKFGNYRIQLVAISAVSNVLGTITNIEFVSQIVHKYGAKLLVDGAQVVAHHIINIKSNNIDYFVFSGHKMYAPFGSGVLLVRKGLLTFDTEKLKRIKSSGEENVAGIAALGKAMVLLEKIGMKQVEDHEKELTRITLNGLNKLKDVVIFGIKNSNSTIFNKKVGIISLNLRGVPHNLAAKELAELGGIGIRDGCFCAHILIQRILKLQKIRVIGARMTSIITPKKTSMCLPGTLRISFGIENDNADVEHFLKTIRIINKKPRSMLNKLLGYSNNGTLFIPKTKTEQKIRRFVEITVKKVFLE